MSDPILMIVRRGALRRFDTLKRKTANLQVNVIWDRRQGPRRMAGCSMTPDRRRGDRRSREASGLGASDFVVAVPGKPSHE
jgi:hypothetical protein